jgi:hypothetical protein
MSNLFLLARDQLLRIGGAARSGRVLQPVQIEDGRRALPLISAQQAAANLTTKKRFKREHEIPKC